MRFIIELDGRGPFSNGQTISGNLLCIFIKTEIVQEITCSLVGLEETMFYVIENHQLIPYSGYEVFLKDESKLLSGHMEPLGTYKSHMQPSGTYKLPFSFNLPDFGIPSSFTNEFGKVSYKIEAIVKGRKLYSKTQETVEVSVSVNLKDMDDITMVPITYPIDETVESRCFRLGCLHEARISMEMTLEKDAFLVGEYIHIELYISNRSVFNTESLKIALLSNTEFIADSPKRRNHVVREEINKYNYGETLAESQKTYSFNLKVPKHLEIPCFNKCILMKRWYTLMVTMVIGDCYNNIELPVKVQLAHMAVAGPRPIGFLQQHSEGSKTLISNNATPFQDIFPLVSVKRPPYPMDATSVPRPSAPVNRPPYSMDATSVPSPSAPVNRPPYPMDVTSKHSPSAPVNRPPYPMDTTSMPSSSAPVNPPVNRPPYPTDATSMPSLSAPVNQPPYPIDATSMPSPSAPVNRPPYPMDATSMPSFSAPVNRPPYPMDATSMPSLSAPVNRPPYPMNATSMPSPKTIPYPLPTVHLPVSYSARQELPVAIPMPMPRRNRAPIAEQETDTLLPENGDETELPPSYDEAIRSAK